MICENDVNSAARLLNRYKPRILGDKYCFGSEYKNGRTFYSFHEEEISEILAKRQCSKNSKKTI